MGGSQGVRALVGTLVVLAIFAASAPAAGASPLVSVTGGSAPEGTGTNTFATFTVHSSEVAPAGGITVLYQPQSAGSGSTAATSSVDYVPPAGNQVTIPEGQQDATVSIEVVADATDEEDQLFALRLTNATTGGAVVDSANNVATWTIIDDDAPPVLSISNGYEGTSASSPLPEGTGPIRQMSFDVTLSAPSEKVVSVGYTTQGGTAKQQVTPGDDGDFQAPPANSRLSIPAGSTSGKISISIIADSRDETNEDFQVLLSAPANTTLDRTAATGTIIDDDGPTANILDATVTEGAAGTDTGVDVTVILDQASVQDVSFVYTTSNDTAVAPADFDAVSTGQTLTIPAGHLTGSIHLNVHGDDIDEGDEQFKVVLQLTANSNASLGDGTAAVTIKDDDPPPALSITSPSVTEGTGTTSTATLTVSLAAPAARNLRIGYTTQDGTATGGSDYQAANSTVDIKAGDTSAQITITIAGDQILEPDETFQVKAFHTTTDASGATVQDTSQPAAFGTVTILDDDLSASNTPNLSIEGASAREGDSGRTGIVFVLRLDAASPRPVTVHFHTADGTAKAGVDYVAGDGVVTFSPGQVTRTITISVLGDTLVEDNEDFTITLADAANARVMDATATGVITDDDVGGGPITLGRGLTAQSALRATSVLCRSHTRCAGVPVQWTTVLPGTIRIDVFAVVPASGKGKKARAARQFALFTRAVNVKPGAGRTRVRLAASKHTSRLLSRVRKAKARQLVIVVTYTNRQGGSQDPARFTLGVT